MKQFSHRQLPLLLLLTSLVSSCQSSTPSTTTSNTQVSTTVTQSAPQTEAPATIAEIQKQPVSVRQLNATQEIAAKPGMGLQFGETIRTRNQAMAQVDLKSGMAFRIGGDAVLTLQPTNQLKLSAGRMITWVQPGQKVPTEIVTPAAIAGIRGTTVYVEIPENPQDEILFFAWEGRVSVRLPGQTEAMELKTGEEVKIRPGERDMGKIRRRIRRLKSQEWRRKLRNDRLLRSFNQPMSTLKIIDKIKPGQVDLSSPVPNETEQPEK
jgi:hypothetical protein